MNGQTMERTGRTNDGRKSGTHGHAANQGRIKAPVQRSTQHVHKKTNNTKKDRQRIHTTQPDIELETGHSALKPNPLSGARDRGTKTGPTPASGAEKWCCGCTFSRLGIPFPPSPFRALGLGIQISPF